jgi:hypothetical protein
MSTTTEELEAQLIRASQKMQMQEMMDEMFEQKLYAMNSLNPDAITNIAQTIMSNTAFLRKIRDWTVSSIDYGDIRDRVLEHLDFNVLAEILMSDQKYGISSNFHSAMLSNTRFRSVVQHCVKDTLDNSDVQANIESVVREITANTSNEAADKALNIIAQRIVEGADV